MEVGAFERPGAALLDPPGSGGELALGAVALAAREVTVAEMTALAALLDLAAEGGCVALLDGRNQRLLEVA